MAGHRQCDAKHHINAYLMVKVWTYGIDGSLQSSLPMPRRSRHGSRWLSELPLAYKLKVAEHTGIISEATRGALAQPHVQGAHTPVLGMGKGAPGSAL